jgi:DNA polymerase
VSERARAFWRLLDSVEDYLRYGERTERSQPDEARFSDESPDAADADADAADAADVPAEPATERSDDGAPGAASQSGATDELETRRRRLAMLEERVHNCTRCPLHDGRMNAVPGLGPLDPLVMVIGEGPGAEEDRRGVPFVGRAGQYLDRWLEAIELDRKTNTYIGNIVKCRPPGNRDPRPHESEACLPYLREQIELIRPRAILTVGRIASGILIGTRAGITSLRGRTFYYEGTPLIPTFHPSAVLRNPDLKRPVWEDLKRLRALLDAMPDAAESDERGPASDGRPDPHV